MWSELQRQRFGVRARLISTEVSAVKAVSAVATAVPPAASRPLRLPMCNSVCVCVCVCVSHTPRPPRRGSQNIMCVCICICIYVCVRMY